MNITIAAKMGKIEDWFAGSGMIETQICHCILNIRIILIFGLSAGISKYFNGIYVILLLLLLLIVLFSCFLSHD